jgi:hypothetical protein
MRKRRIKYTGNARIGSEGDKKKKKCLPCPRRLVGWFAPID